MPDKTVRAIGTDQPRSLHDFFCAIAMTQGGNNAGRRSGELCQFDAPLNSRLERVQESIEHPFGLVLRDHQRIRVHGLDPFENEVQLGS